jgi:predicted AAA+ superfamily ATPase
MLERLIEKRVAASRKSVLLLGARQVGKSTLARSLAPDVIIDLADEGSFLAHAKDPGLVGREVRALQRPSLVLVDEVQRLPSVLNSVQAILDQGLKHRFVLTGSSARKLKRGGANLLPGRVILEHLDPFSIWELGPSFDLERALSVGCLPGIYLDHESGADTLEAYATLYLREEVQAEALVRNVGSYARFLDVAATESGNWINYAKLASDSEISKETLRRYYQILEDTLLAFRMEPYRPARSQRRVSHRDRIFFFDIGVRNALLGLHRQPPSPTERGRLFEHWFILQCLYFARAHHLPWTLTSYRTDAGAEVDAVIDTPKTLVAIECKAGRHVAGSELSGLRSFASIAHKKVLAYVVFQGERPQTFPDGVEAIPYRQFLLERLPALVG